MDAKSALWVTRAILAVVASVILVALASMMGCAVLWTVGGAMGGAALGSPGGPPGMIIGAGVGGGAGHLYGENKDLRSGDLQGEGAADKEIERLKGKASGLQDTLVALKRLVTNVAVTALAAIAIWFFFRNRHNFSDLGLWNGVKHGLLGGDFGNLRHDASTSRPTSNTRNSHGRLDHPDHRRVHPARNRHQPAEPLVAEAAHDAGRDHAGSSRNLGGDHESERTASPASAPSVPASEPLLIRKEIDP